MRALLIHDIGSLSPTSSHAFSRPGLFRSLASELLCLNSGFEKDRAMWSPDEMPDGCQRWMDLFLGNTSFAIPGLIG